jgi:hypothetical protein
MVMSNILRARVTKGQKWWEIKLLDLDIVADGKDEADMLRTLEHELVAEFHLAIKFNKTPFVDLVKTCPDDVAKSWQDGGQNLRRLTLPDDVRRALAAVFRLGSPGTFQLDTMAA